MALSIASKLMMKPEIPLCSFLANANQASRKAKAGAGYYRLTVNNILIQSPDYLLPGIYRQQVIQAQIKRNDMCVNKLLAQCGSTVIHHCPDCGMLNVWHNNLLLCFTPEQFNAFYNFAAELNLNERIFLFSDGSERLILCTPNTDINFVFTLFEWQEFKSAMAEAYYMHEINSILK